MRERRLRSLSIFVLTVCLLGSCRTLFANSCVALFAKSAMSGKVIYLRQLHWTPQVEGRPELVNYIAASQYHIMKQIMGSPETPVFVEGIPFVQKEGWSVKTLPSQLLGGEHQIRRLFSKGIPDRFELLSTQQKDILARNGAPLVLLVLGHIPRVFGTDRMTTDEYSRIETRLEEAIDRWGNELIAFEKDPILKVLVMGRREREAQNILGAYLKSNPELDMFLIFGGGHEFKKYWPEDGIIELDVGFRTIEARFMRAVRQQ